MARGHKAGCYLGFLLLVFSLSMGCVSHRDLARSSVHFNKAVEDGQNQMLLLNVVRASMRRPMYLTSFSKVTGSNSASLELNLPKGAGSSAKGTFGTNPTFDVPVLDSQEFTTGFLTPIRSGVLRYYWDQDWPEEFLLHMLVQKVRVRIEEEGTTRDYYFWNHPDISEGMQHKLCKLEKFSRWINYFVEVANPGFQPAKENPVGPEYRRDEISLPALLELQKEGFEIDEVGGLYRLRPASKEFTLVIFGKLAVEEKLRVEDNRSMRPVNIIASADEATRRLAFWTEASTRLICNSEEFEAYDTKPPATERQESTAGEKTKDLPSDNKPQEAAAEDRLQEPVAGGAIRSGNQEFTNEQGKKSTLTVTLFMRSPEAVLYYLGQLTRIIEEQKRVPLICIDGKRQPLFVARKVIPSCSSGAVNVQYDNHWYTIPRNNALKTGVSSKGRAVRDPGCEIVDFTGEDKGDSFVNWAEHANLHVASADAGCDAGRSMQALSLLTQLVNLQKSGKDLPTTGTVRVIGIP